MALLAFVVAEREASAHAVPRLYVSVGPVVAIEPARRLPLLGGSLVLGLGVDPERDAVLFRCTLLTSTTAIDRDPLPEGELAWAGGFVGYRSVFSRDGAVRPFATLWLGGAGTIQGLAGGRHSALPSLAVAGDLGLRLNDAVTIAIEGTYSAPVPAAPIAFVLQLGLP